MLEWIDKSYFLFALLIPATSLAVPSNELQRYPCSFDEASLKVVVEKDVLFICYFGSTPEHKKDGWVHVAGVSFNRLRTGEKLNPEFIAQADEVGLGVDYRIKNSTLEIVAYIDAYPSFDAVPFYKETIKLDRFPATREVYMIYMPSRVTKNEAIMAANLLKIKEETYRHRYQNQWPDWIYKKLFVLRDFAFIEPAWVLTSLSAMQDYWWNDGEISEVYEDMINDISTINETKRRSGDTQLESLKIR